MSSAFCRRKFLASCVTASVVLPALAIPKLQFPRPKFHIGQEVIAPWENDTGMQYSRAVIIGMAHNPTGYQEELEGWWYLPRWTDNPECPWMLNKDDGHFWHERWIKAV